MDFVQVVSKEIIFLFAKQVSKKTFKASPDEKTTLSRDTDSNQNNNSSFSGQQSKIQKSKEYM